MSSEAAQRVHDVLAAHPDLPEYEQAHDDIHAVMGSIESLAGERDRYRAALDQLDGLDPDDFKGGQDHLTPAFREVDFRSAFRAVCRIVNGVLHGTDEHGQPLRGCDHLSATGVDQVEGPEKVWRCDACGWLYRNEPGAVEGTVRMVPA